MLFESKTLLIAPCVEHLVPLSFALHSLIYPFKMCLFVPCLANDGEDYTQNSLNLVSSPLNYFMGISQNDKKTVMLILEDDEFDPPLIIEVKDEKGIRSTSLTQKEMISENKNFGPILPSKLYKELVNKIE